MSHKFIAIVACSKNFGIGLNNSIPWNIKEDRSFFCETTTNNVVIMGLKTFESLPNKSPLKNRINVVLSNKYEIKKESEELYFCNYDNLTYVLEDFSSDKKIFVIGGEKIYKLFENNYEEIFLTYIDKSYTCDVFFPKISNEYSIQEYSKKHWSDTESCNYRFIKYLKHKTEVCDSEYLSLATKVLDQSKEIRVDRTGTGTYSIFGQQISFDISKFIPILSTKRVPWKSCIEELLWFMRGDTDANILKNKGVNIWNLNSTKEFQSKVGLGHLEEGDCGANYSFQWRYCGQEYKTCKSIYEKNTKYDQINNIINQLKTNPFSRRIFMSAWNPCDLDKTVLPPCHVSVQFYVDNNYNLSCHMYQRSCDIFLGLPWNILSYSILTYILAKKCNMKPDRLIISFGDTHIYSNHVEQMKTQLERSYLSPSILEIKDNVKEKNIEEIDINDFDIIGYFPHKAIQGDMSV
tara:strand:+ start:220 stop:1608 length:1389 start_codon:yes stop_codon:yes gene_type:complete